MRKPAKAHEQPDADPVDHRAHPELYRVGRGEQGVLTVEPYKSEILPHWRFRTPEVARESANAISRLFERYRSESDFVGMDMARKFLQMGYTRSRRFANHKGGRKYDPATGQPLEGPGDPDYLRLKAIHRRTHERKPPTVDKETKAQA